jgi:hypothetical protein
VIRGFTKDEIRSYVNSKLGGSFVAVELKNEDIDNCIEDALRDYNHYLINPEHHVIYNLNQYTTVKAPPEAKGVLAVEFLTPNSLTSGAEMNIFEMVYRSGAPRYPYGTWYSLRSFYKTYRETRGSNPEWRYDPASKQLYLFAWGGPWDVGYSWDLMITDSVQIKDRDAQYQQVFLMGVLAYAREILSNVRGKFGSIPSPGGAITLNSEKLSAKADEGIKAYKEQLKKLSPPTGPMLG